MPAGPKNERRMRKIRFGAVAAVVVLFGALGLFVWMGGGAASADIPATASGAARGGVRWHRLEAQPLATSISLLGNIEPLEIRHLTSPFKGRVGEYCA